MGCRFGEFELHEELRELKRGDEVVRVEPRVFDLLCFLVEHRDRAVSKDELIRSVWGHSALTDAGLSQTVGRLRRLLGDSSEKPRYVATVHGFGYRWLADVSPATTTAASEPDRSPPDRAWRRPVLVTLLLVTLGVLVLLAARTFAPPYTEDIEQVQAQTARLLILPFEQRGEQSMPPEALRGLAELLRQDLSDRSRRLVVMSTGSAARLAANQLDPVEQALLDQAHRLQVSLAAEDEGWTARLIMSFPPSAERATRSQDRVRASDLETLMAHLSARILAMLDDASLGESSTRMLPLPARRAEAIELARIGRRDEARAIYNELLARFPDDQELQLGLGVLYCFELDSERCQSIMQPLVDQARDVRTAVLSRQALAELHVALGDGATADAWISEMAQLDQDGLDPWLRAEISSTRAYRAFVAGRYRQALEQERLSQRMHLMIGEARSATVSQIRSAAIEGLGIDRWLAISHLEQAAEQMRKMNNAEGEAVALLVASIFHWYAGQLDQAYHAARSVELLAPEASDRSILAEALERQGQVLASRGQHAEAAELLARAVQMGRDLGHLQRYLTAALRLAIVQDAGHALDPDRPAELLALVDDPLTPVVQAGMLSELSLLALRTGNAELATEARDRLERLASDWPDHELMPAMLAWTHARTLADAGDSTAALDALRPAWDMRHAGIIALEALAELKAGLLNATDSRAAAAALLQRPDLAHLDGSAIMALRSRVEVGEAAE